MVKGVISTQLLIEKEKEHIPMAQDVMCLEPLLLLSLVGVNGSHGDGGYGDGGCSDGSCGDGSCGDGSCGDGDGSHGVTCLVRK